MTGQDHITPTTPPDHGGSDKIEKLDPSTASHHADNSCAESFGDEKVQPALDAFGDETGAEVKYKTMHWWQASLIMVAENMSLGILSLPAVFVHEWSRRRCARTHRDKPFLHIRGLRAVAVPDAASRGGQLH